jgi:hypothetical protein
MEEEDPMRLYCALLLGDEDELSLVVEGIVSISLKHAKVGGTLLLLLVLIGSSSRFQVPGCFC